MSSLRDRLMLFRRKFSSGFSIYRQNKAGILGIMMLLLFVLVAVFAPYIAPYNPYKRVDR